MLSNKITCQFCNSIVVNSTAHQNTVRCQTIQNIGLDQYQQHQKENRAKSIKKKREHNKEIVNCKICQTEVPRGHLSEHLKYNYCKSIMKGEKPKKAPRKSKSKNIPVAIIEPVAKHSAEQIQQGIEQREETNEPPIEENKTENSISVYLIKWISRVAINNDQLLSMYPNYISWKNKKREMREKLLGDMRTFFLGKMKIKTCIECDGEVEDGLKINKCFKCYLKKTHTLTEEELCRPTINTNINDDDDSDDEDNYDDNSEDEDNSNTITPPQKERDIIDEGEE